MPKPVVFQGAQLRCSLGLSPSTLVLQPGVAAARGKAVATVMNFQPLVNIPPFGMCISVANPQVAAATAAASGTLTPQPCLPVVTGPWMPGAGAASVQGAKLLTGDSICNCQWLGVISVSEAGTEVSAQ